MSENFVIKAFILFPNHIYLYIPAYKRLKHGYPIFTFHICHQVKIPIMLNT